MLKIAVCDDEQIILDTIVRRVEAEFRAYHQMIEIVVFHSGEDFLDTFLKEKNRNAFDIVFLDIELRTANGIKIAEVIRKNGYTNFIVFVTSFVDYAVWGYKAGAFRYILKSGMEYLLAECIREMVELLRLRTLKSDVLDVLLHDILYVESDNHKLIVHLTNGEKQRRYMTLNELEETLDFSDFCRIHQSYLVNMNYVELIKRYEVKMEKGITLPVSKSKYQEANKTISMRRAMWR